jgi:hypothetical protein
VVARRPQRNRFAMARTTSCSLFEFVLQAVKAIRNYP